MTMSVPLPNCVTTTVSFATRACCSAAGHRGTQEIDLIFGSFAESAAGGLSPVQLVDVWEGRRLRHAA